MFLTWNAPRYLIAFTVHLVCYSLLVLVMLYLRWHLRRENSKKDALAQAGIREANDQQYVHAFEDLTDKENLNFRYVF